MYTSLDSLRRFKRERCLERCYFKFFTFKSPAKSDNANKKRIYFFFIPINQTGFLTHPTIPAPTFHPNNHSSNSFEQRARSKCTLAIRPSHESPTSRKRLERVKVIVRLLVHKRGQVAGRDSARTMTNKLAGRAPTV